MKKLFGIGSLFLLTSSMVYVGLLWCLNSFEMGGTPFLYRVCDGITWYGGDTHQTFLDYEESGPNDIVVLGSSHAYRGYDPGFFKRHGLEMFNLGSHSQSLSDTRILLEEVVRKDETDLVIIDLYSVAFASDGIESGSFLISNLQSDRAAFRIGWNMGDIRALNMFTIRMLNKGKEPFMPLGTYDQRGYCSKTDSVDSNIDYSQYGNYFDSQPKQLSAFVELVEYGRENDIEMIFVAHPQAKEMKRKAQEEFHRYLNDEFKDGEIVFLDYTFEHELSSTDHFYDHTHLNSAGVELFNGRLLQDMRERGLIQ